MHRKEKGFGYFGLSSFALTEIFIHGIQWHYITHMKLCQGVQDLHAQLVKDGPETVLEGFRSLPLRNMRIVSGREATETILNVTGKMQQIWDSRSTTVVSQCLIQLSFQIRLMCGPWFLMLSVQLSNFSGFGYWRTSVMSFSRMIK